MSMGNIRLGCSMEFNDFVDLGNSCHSTCTTLRKQLIACHRAACLLLTDSLEHLKVSCQATAKIRSATCREEILFILAFASCLFGFPCLLFLSLGFAMAFMLQAVRLKKLYLLDLCILNLLSFFYLN